MIDRNRDRRREQMFIKGNIDVGIEPRFLRILKDIRRNSDCSFPKGLKRLDNYLYEVWFDNIDYQFAKEYHKDHGDFSTAMCSSIRKGVFLGRNFDWIYSENVTFVVHTPQLAGRFASIGVSGTVPKLTKQFVESGEYSEMYKLIPFKLVDGINEKGVAVSTNVVPTDKGTNITVPLIEKRDSISSIMLVRYILDNFSSAQEAAEYIRDYVEVYTPKDLHSQSYEQHYLICDSANSYCIEFVDNEVKILDVAEYPFMTNFYLYEVEFNEDHSVYTPETQDEEHNAIITNKITPNGSGLERYNLINSRISEIESKEDFSSLMTDLKYTRSYPSGPAADPFWYTEFVMPDYGLTVASNPEDFAAILEVIDEHFINRSRDPKSEYNDTWQTQHCSIYDIMNKTLQIRTQENFETSFNIKISGGGSEQGEPELQILKAERAVGSFDEDGNPIRIDNKFLPEAITEELEEIIEDITVLDQKTQLLNENGEYPLDAIIQGLNIVIFDGGSAPVYEDDN